MYVYVCVWGGGGEDEFRWLGGREGDSMLTSIFVGSIGIGLLLSCSAKRSDSLVPSPPGYFAHREA